MPVSLANMCDCHSVLRSHPLKFIVMFGLHPLLKYYLVVLDDFTHFCWTFPLKHKSDVFTTFVNFHSYVRTQLNLPIKIIQADNGNEFVNSRFSTFLAHHGIITHLSCPYTSPQNGKAERMLHTINNTVRILLIHAFMPPTYWVEALSTATFLINRLPSTTTPTSTPFNLLHNKEPTYQDLLSVQLSLLSQHISNHRL
jgi:transposase InsO family protein